MLTIGVDGIEDADEMLMALALIGQNVETAAIDAIDTEAAGLVGHVVSEIDAVKAIGATKILRTSIVPVPAHKTETGWQGGVFAGRSAAAQPIQARIIEGGAKPHATRKHPYFWIRTLADWVKRKEGLNITTKGGKPVVGKKGRVSKTSAAQAALRAVAVGIGRKVERVGIEARRPFARTFEAHASGIADRMAAFIDEAIIIALGGRQRT